MQKRDVKVGQTYLAKVSGKVQQIRLEAESRWGGWAAINLATGRPIHVRSARRLSLCGVAPAPKAAL